MLTKTRHNKKRNTAFIYEALVRELTKCVVANDQERKGVIVSLIKEHFAKGSILREELDLYKALYETSDLESRVCEKLILEVKISHSQLDQEDIFREQTSLINKINKLLSKEVFANFVPNYKNLATISQILNPSVSVKHRVLLETSLVSMLASPETREEGKLYPMDNLIYKTFVDRFNEQYGGKLLEDQERLLSKYIASFSDDGMDLKIFLNEEIGRLKSALSGVLNEDTQAGNEVLCENTQRVLSMLDSYRTSEIDTQTVKQILKIQSLVGELRN